MADYKRRMRERLEQGMAEQSISRETLAAKAEVSEKTIKRLVEEKTETPQPVTVRRLARALKIEPSELRPPPEVEADQLNRIEKNLKLLAEGQAEILEGLAELREPPEDGRKSQGRDG